MVSPCRKASNDTSLYERQVLKYRPLTAKPFQTGHTLAIRAGEQVEILRLRMQVTIQCRGQRAGS